jgi:hypothetical protein
VMRGASAWTAKGTVETKASATVALRRFSVMPADSPKDFLLVRLDARAMPWGEEAFKSNA